MTIEKINPKELDELSCAEQIGIVEINDNPCLIVKGPKKDGTIHYTIIQADLLGEHLYQLFGPMNDFFRDPLIPSNN